MAFGYKRTLTIDHTQVPNTDQSDFPVLVSLTSANLKTVGNGGHVQSSSAYDILFYSDSNLTTQLDHQIEKFDATTGEIVMWVRVPSVSHSTDTVFYMAYGDATISTSQEDAAGLWGSSVKGVYHLGNGSTLSVADGSGNAHNGTNNSATATAGKVDGGAALSGSSQYITLPSTADWNFGTGDFTLSCWFFVDVVSAGYQMLIGKDTDTNRQWTFGVNTGATGETNAVQFGSFGGVNIAVGTNNNSISDDTWYFVCVTRTSGTLQIFLNGVAGMTDPDATDYTGTGQLWLGARQYPGFPQYLDGSLDEVRIIKGAARSADWITTEYNNQSAPGTFITLGSETPLSNDYTLTADQASFTLTGQTTGLKAGRKLTADFATFTETGQTVNLLRGLKISLTHGSFTETGQDALFRRGLRITLTHGSFTLTGQDVTLTPSARRLVAATGLFTFTGYSAVLSGTLTTARASINIAQDNRTIGVSKEARTVYD